MPGLYSRVILAALALMLPRAIQAQTPLVATGRVTKPTQDSITGVSGIWVTLHRVAKDIAGPIDSVRTDAQGRYRISYNPSKSPDAVYFTASVYKSIAYFSLPLGRTTSTDEGDITVFDTTSHRVPLKVQGRHLVLSTPTKSGERKVTEVFEISNDTFVTKVAVGESKEGASWSIQLPKGAQSPQLMEGDLPAAAAKFTEGQLLVFAPFAPGLKQIAYTYTLEPSAFPLTFPIESAAAVLEVLTEESNTKVTGARLAQVSPVTVEGRNFRRYLASDAPENTVVSIELTDVETSINPIFVAILTIIIGGIMVGTLIWSIRKRR